MEATIPLLVSKARAAPQRRTRKVACFQSASIAAVAFLLIASAARAAQPKHVLIVHSFGAAAPPFSVHSIAFESELVEHLGERVDLDEVSLDMARYAESNVQDALVDYLAKRQTSWKPDLVVPIGSPAAIFVAKYRTRLFPDAPVLYTSLDQRLLPPGALNDNATYVGQKFDVPGLLQDMLEVAPATKNIAVVVGATPLEEYWLGQFRKAAEPLARRINFIYYNDQSFDQILERTATLPPDSYIFVLLLLRDAAGVTHNADQALERLRKTANAPINSIFEHQLGLGIVGGRLYQSERLGREAGKVAIRILHGESAASLPAQLIDRLPPRYDWRELHRWHMDEKHLPPGSEVLFRSPTIWEQHRNLIIGGVAVCIAEALLIGALVANLIRRQGAERSLSESEGRFRTMANAAPVLIWMAGTEKECTFNNRAWLEFTGRRSEEDLGDGWVENLHPGDRANSFKTYENAFDRRESFVMQYRLRRHDGVYRTITAEGIPRYGPNGNFRGYIGACVDITDLLQQQKALHEIEDRVALAAEAAHLGVWELDLANNELWASEKVRELFHLAPAGPISYSDLVARVHPEDQARRDEEMQRAVESGGDYETEYRALLPDGTVRWMAGRARCIADESGKTCRIIGVSIDISLRKAAEEESRRRREQVERLSRTSLLGEMTASLAHELNQPLSAIVSNASAGARFIDRGHAPPEQIREILEDVVADGRRAHEIIMNVRNAIKKGSVLRASVNLNDVVTSVTHMVRPDAVAHSCQLQTTLEENLPPINADPVQIQQVLINLVTNAIDAMRGVSPPNRNVEIGTAHDGNGNVQVTVRDYGSGIPDDAQNRLFEQFFSTKDEGLGMGLSIVRSVIEAHGGQVSAENAVGGGARFRFNLPTANGTKV